MDMEKVVDPLRNIEACPAWLKMPNRGPTLSTGFSAGRNVLSGTASIQKWKGAGSTAAILS